MDMAGGVNGRNWQDDMDRECYDRMVSCGVSDARLGTRVQVSARVSLTRRILRFFTKSNKAKMTKVDQE